MKNKLSQRLIETAEAGILIKFSTLKKRNIVLFGKKTSVTLEPLVWDILHRIAEEEECHVNDLCEYIAEKKHPESSLASAIRVFVIAYTNIQLNKA